MSFTLGKSEHQFRFEVWLAQSNYDLNAAKVSMKAGFYEWACFQAEQSAEKALKSVIVYNGKSAPKLHKLGVLVGIIKNIDQRFRGIHIDISQLQSYTFITRYPFLVPGSFETPHDYINRDDAEICINKATVIYNLIRELLHA